MSLVVRKLIGIVMLLAALSGTAQRSDEFQSDDSDWWSELNPKAEMFNTPVQRRVLSTDSLSILGLTPLERGDDNWLQPKLGLAKVVFRGDAGNARAQVCYASQERDVFLISESGEVNLGFYILAKGMSWRGEELCRVSALVNKRITTGSGLRLGLTPSQVKAILGKPSLEMKNFLYYTSEVKVPISLEAREIKKNGSHSRANINTGSSDFYYLSVSITVRFKSGKLSYLHVDKAEID